MNATMRLEIYLDDDDQIKIIVGHGIPQIEFGAIVEQIYSGGRALFLSGVTEVVFRKWGHIEAEGVE